MSRKEILNKDIDLAAKLLHFLLVSFFGLCAYAFINHKELDLIEIIVLLIVGLCLVAGEIVAIKQYLKTRKELEKL